MMKVVRRDEFGTLAGVARMRLPGGWPVWFLGRLVARSALGVLAGLALLLLPIPWNAGLGGQLLQSGLGAFLVVCSLGKALYDTLFYDRYWP